jgi:hypothetical protein
METGQWFLDIPASMTGNGRRKRRLYRTREEAVAVARGLKSRIDPVSGQLIPQAPKSGLSFRDATALWCEDEELRVQTLKKRASTLEADLHRLKSLCTFFGDRDVASITDRDLAEYQAWRLNLGRKPRTINTELGTLSLVLRWASHTRGTEDRADTGWTECHRHSQARGNRQGHRSLATSSKAACPVSC